MDALLADLERTLAMSRWGDDPAASPMTRIEAPPSLLEGITLPLGPSSAARRTEGQVDLRPHISIGPTIGEGGMGVVRSAIQHPLGRRVAVKMARTTDPSSDGLAALLQEARVAGRLEHPNMVPVYQLEKDASGAPLLVMKYIEGTPWSAFIGDPDCIATLRPGERDPLAFHLSVLVKVCDAIQYAHAHGIVHRDIKLDNVMLGPFGEVYVLDWGVAVTLRSDDTQLPRARDVCTIVGTPCYMAPEMASAIGAAIDERTDVYLLGATLHEILTGRPRHEGATMLQTLARSIASHPYDYDAGVPPALATIANRATAALPSERYLSAAAFRQAIDEYLDRRGALDLLREASSRLAELESLCHQPHHDPLQIQRLGVEARFGFEMALRAWHGCHEARVGRDRALAVMARYEIARKNRDAAATLVSELHTRNPELQRAFLDLERSLSRRSREVAELERMRDEADTHYDVDRRRRRVLSLGLLFAGCSLFCWLLELTSGYRTGYREVIAIVAVMDALLLHFALDRRPTNLANRRLRYAMVAGQITVTAYLIIAAILGVPVSHALATAMIIGGTAALVSAFTISRETLWMAAGFGLTAVALFAFPAQRSLIMFLGIAVTYGAVAVAWHVARAHARRATSAP